MEGVLKEFKYEGESQRFERNGKHLLPTACPLCNNIVSCKILKVLSKMLNLYAHICLVDGIWI